LSAVLYVSLALVSCKSEPRQKTAELLPPATRTDAPPPPTLAKDAAKVEGGVEGGMVGGVVGNGAVAYLVMAPPPSLQAQIAERPFNTEEYGRFDENAFLRAADNPLSTFSIDVDRASY